jgi:hypothetical protein
LREDSEVIFTGDATIQLSPTPEGLHAFVADSIEIPPILVKDSQNTLARGGFTGARTRDGLTLFGVDSAGIAYAWRINGSAERYFQEPLSSDLAQIREKVHGLEPEL